MEILVLSFATVPSGIVARLPRFVEREGSLGDALAADPAPAISLAADLRKAPYHALVAGQPRHAQTTPGSLHDAAAIAQRSPSVITGVSCLIGFGYSPVAVLNVSSDDTIASDGSGASGWFRLRNVRGRGRFTSAELFARKIAFCRMFVLNANSRRRHERRRQRSVRARQGTGR